MNIFKPFKENTTRGKRSEIVSVISYIDDKEFKIGVDWANGEDANCLVTMRNGEICEVEWYE